MPGTNPAFIFVNPVVMLGPTGATASTDVTCELTRAEITNDTSMVDTGSLCGPMEQPGKIKYTLELEGYQAWGGTPLRLLDFLWTNARVQAPFSLLTQNAAASVTNPRFSGIVVCVPGEVGGTREEAAVFSVALPIVGTPTRAITMMARELDALNENRALHGLDPLSTDEVEISEDAGTPITEGANA